jgi:hypothetical protein
LLAAGHCWHVGSIAGDHSLQQVTCSAEVVGVGDDEDVTCWNE